MGMYVCVDFRCHPVFERQDETNRKNGTDRERGWEGRTQMLRDKWMLTNQTF